MKFLPEDKKKILWYAAIILVSLVGIVYINFFHGRPKIAVVDKDAVRKALESGAPPSRLPSAQTSPSLTSEEEMESSRQAKIDTRVLESEKFKSLKAGPKVMIKPEELGKTELFSR